MENGKHRVFNFVMSSFDINLLNDKLNYVLKEQKCAAKVYKFINFASLLKDVPMGCRDSLS